MANMKFSFLKNSAETTNIEKRDDYPILDPIVIEFISKEFPDLSKNITKSLNNLKETLESSIDSIEDRSSEIVKSNRDFSLSGDYRSASIRLHEISISIDKYINWVNSNSSLQKSSIENDTEKVIKTTDTITNINIVSKNELFVFDDFTGKSPKSFELDNLNILVDSWEDLIMKTADTLIKHYKHNKELNLEVPKIDVVDSKKSIQNDFRDTIIEMLLEYKIDPYKYKIKL
ncbi:hypothetical protein K4H43_03170 [Clostridium chauvoei]|uniref:hypothetical protein n=1 Tax=Clostridium chauvoei TaxID=46867 RepID=UPI001C85DF37|nr:hypothetical protein [Clostridium chauvoei]MBX7310055.1 hypothetical protein [Clostridium chauvoei]MBX7314942.1 hypothetical protein [Clostridium chauvoei]MBX7342951.1 hypothetical protein [Clostridium chauvoei]